MAAFLIGIILAIVEGFADGLIIAKLWTWFIVPLGVRSISVSHAAGLCVMYIAFTLKIPDGDPDLLEVAWKSLVTWIGKAVVCLTIGWIAHSLM